MNKTQPVFHRRDIIANKSPFRAFCYDCELIAAFILLSSREPRVPNVLHLRQRRLPMVGVVWNLSGPNTRILANSSGTAVDSEQCPNPTNKTKQDVRASFRRCSENRLRRFYCLQLATDDLFLATYRLLLFRFGYSNHEPLL
jgi:hypothetical protein